MTDGVENDTEELQVLAAEYALGLLSEEEAAAFEDLLTVDDEFRAVYAQWAEDFAQLGEALPSEVPPKTVWTRIEGDLFPDTKQNLLQKLGLLPSILGGLVAALLVLMVTDQLGLMRDGPTEITTVQTAELEAQEGGITLQARFDTSTGRLEIGQMEGSASDGTSLELWMIVGSDAPVSLGILSEDGTLAADLTEDLRSKVPGAILAVSEEPSGGSPSGAPSGDVVAMGSFPTR
jgi:anti-sigma-K factor RskA